MKVFYTLTALLTFAVFNAQKTSVFQSPSNNVDISQKNPEFVYIQNDRPNDTGVVSGVLANGSATYVSDDFTLTKDADVSTFGFGGTQKQRNLPSLCTGIVLYVYSDDNGKPSGIPGDGKPAILAIDINALPSTTAEPTPYTGEPFAFMAGFTVDVVAATGSSLHLNANTKYWVVFAPKLTLTAESTQNSWFWLNNDQVNDKAKWVARPGATGWNNISGINGLGFFLVGEFATLGTDEVYNSIKNIMVAQDAEHLVIVAKDEKIETSDIYSADGKKVIASAAGNKINISALSKGVYVISVKMADGKTSNTRFIKK